MPAPDTSEQLATAAQFRHHRAGNGEPLVLIHGVGHHWQGWLPVLPALEQSFEVLAVDSPGFGESAPLPAGASASIASYTRAFESWFADLGLGRPHVAGNSMGGAIAIELARRGSVRSATAFSPAGFWTPAERTYCQRSLGNVAAIPKPLHPVLRAAVRTRLGRRALLAQLIARPANVDADAAVGDLDALWNAPSFDAAIAAFDEYRCAPFATPPAAPVSLVWGVHDRLLLAKRQSARARRVLPEATHRWIDAGHLPSWDAPVSVVQEIRATVKRSVVPRA